LARYDDHAAWYDAFLHGGGGAHTARVTARLAELLGSGPGRCLDVGCGTGAHAAALQRLRWSVVGVDPSAGQLGIARHRLPVVLGDGARLPARTASVDAAVATLIHTDVEDWAAVLAEVRRVLRPGGRFAYVGVHPCFVSPYAVVRADHVALVPGLPRPVAGVRLAGVPQRSHRVAGAGRGAAPDAGRGPGSAAGGRAHADADRGGRRRDRPRPARVQRAPAAHRRQRSRASRRHAGVS
jgi:SAM-dependent methyltransferase